MIDRSKSLPPGLKLNSPEAMYKFEKIATDLLMQKQKQMRKRRREKGEEDGTIGNENFGAKDNSIIMEDS